MTRACQLILDAQELKKNTAFGCSQYTKKCRKTTTIFLRLVLIFAYTVFAIYEISGRFVNIILTTCYRICCDAFSVVKRCLISILQDFYRIKVVKAVFCFLHCNVSIYVLTYFTIHYKLLQSINVILIAIDDRIFVAFSCKFKNGAPVAAIRAR